MNKDLQVAVLQLFVLVMGICGVVGEILHR